MRRTSVILSLVLTTLVSAELPYNSGVFNEIEFTSVGALQKASFNAFTAWVAALPLDGSGTNFKMGFNSPVGSVQVTRVTGFDPACIVQAGRRLDFCASRIEETSPSDRILKIYTQVKKSDGTIVNVPLTQEIPLQNIMIRAVGRVFGMPWNYTNTQSVMSDKPLESDWGLTSSIKFPTTDDASLLRTLYSANSPFNVSNSLAPIALMETKNASGAVVSGIYMKGVIGQSYYGSLKQLRWIVSDRLPDAGGSIPSIVSRSNVTVGGRITNVAAPSCYAAGQNVFAITGAGSSVVDYYDAIADGAHMTQMLIESATKYDFITSQHPGTANCQRAAGNGLDVWGETSW